MLMLGKYDELAPGMGFPSLRNHINSRPYRAKEAVLAHMRNGSVHMVTASRFTDVFTGLPIDVELVHMNDGVYSWSSKIIYYVEKYNLRLPQEFEDHVLNTKNIKH